VPGPYLALVSQTEQPLMQGAKDRAGAFALLDCEVRPRDISDEKRVAAEERPLARPASAVDQNERGVLGTVPRGMDGAEEHIA
jgi:hypothetical protein